MGHTCIGLVFQKPKVPLVVIQDKKLTRSTSDRQQWEVKASHRAEGRRSLTLVQRAFEPSCKPVKQRNTEYRARNDAVVGVLTHRDPSSPKPCRGFPATRRGRLQAAATFQTSGTLKFQPAPSFFSTKSHQTGYRDQRVCTLNTSRESRAPLKLQPCPQDVRGLCPGFSFMCLC